MLQGNLRAKCSAGKGNLEGAAPPSQQLLLPGLPPAPPALLRAGCPQAAPSVSTGLQHSPFSRCTGLVSHRHSTHRILCQIRRLIPCFPFPFPLFLCCQEKVAQRVLVLPVSFPGASPAHPSEPLVVLQWVSLWGFQCEGHRIPEGLGWEGP